MLDIFLREAGHPRGILIAEFVHELTAICRSHIEKGRALAFAFILFDYDHPEVRKVLDDQAYWDALDKISGHYLTVFALNLQAERDIRARHRQRGESPGNRPVVESVRALLEELFRTELPTTCPLILFFQVENDRISTPYLCELKAGSIELAFHEIRDALSAAVDSVERVRPEFPRTTHDVFEVIKQDLIKRKSLHMAKITTGPGTRLSKLFSVIVSSNPTAWETDQLMRMDAARFKEYSDGPGAAAVDRANPETLNMLNGTPALLMYEDGSGAENKDTVRFGLVREVKLAGDVLTFRFEQEGQFRRKVVAEFGDRLGIDSFEYNRTHWAIKDGAIPSAMLATLQRTYDIVLSFAGEDRKYVEAVARHLRSKGVKVFYDTFEQPALWGKDLAEHLDSVYQHAGRYCVIFISKHYAEKMWTRHERRSALARALRQEKEYILPARFDDTELEGIRHTTAYISLAGKRPASLSKLILEKLGRQAPRSRKRNAPAGSVPGRHP